jgi:Tol biopolymer transport system component
MRLSAGVKLGAYEILGPLGAGGMGEVYRGRDSKLGREVAIKILPEAFASDPERVARFNREARMLAALNHPGIAAIYGFEQAEGVPFLVMEYVPGETLKGPLEVEDAVAIAVQIADALEAAHGKGIIHRDLKPANVKLTPDRKVKVLDFGLAKINGDDDMEADPSQSPTVTIGATRGAVILGTAAYMSPEQARGQPVDRRSDIWAYGCVLYELLTGLQAFQGKTISDTLAAVLRAEPDWSAVPANVPERVRYLLNRCLSKDLKLRLHDIGEARVLIGEAAALDAAAAPQRPDHRFTWLPWAAAGLMTLAAAAALWALWQARQTAHPVIRAPLNLPPGDRLVLPGVQPAVALSPDGTRLVYSGFRGPLRQLFLRRMDLLDGVPISGTEDGDGPFFSPDGEWVGYFAGGKLKKTLVRGGAPVILAEAASPRGASWGEDDNIAFAPSSAVGGGLMRVSANGGIPQTLTTSDRQDVHRWPQILPGGKGILLTISKMGSPDDGRIAVLRLDTRELRIVVEGGSDGRYIPTGHLVYARSGGLVAVPFDVERLQVTGRQVPIMEGVMTNSLGAAHFTFSSTGSLIYVPGGLMTSPKAVLWVDRKGGVTEVTRTDAHAYWPRVSPDGRRIAISTVEGSNVDVWVNEPARNGVTRLTFAPGLDAFPVWTHDGRRLIFTSTRSGALNLYWRAADGSGAEERLTDSPNSQLPSDVSPDGKWLAFYEHSSATGADIWVLPLEGERRPKAFLQTSAWEGEARFSPDGRWLAYVSLDTGRAEVWVQAFPDGASKGKWLVSSGGGREPVWSPNGQELFYRNGDRVMAVEVTTGTSFVAGKPRVLFEGQYFGSPGFLNFDVAPDGQRFLMLKEPASERALAHFNLVVNWFEELKQRVK